MELANNKALGESIKKFEMEFAECAHNPLQLSRRIELAQALDSCFKAVGSSLAEDEIYPLFAKSNTGGGDAF
jgi:hypothetical protein